MTSSITPREQALIRAKSFCEAFALESSLQILATHFSKNVIIFEHGPPTIDELPFLGREFRGLEGLDVYLKLVKECLILKKVEFGDWSCDTQAVIEGAGGSAGITVVTVKGTGDFEFKDTKKGWKEQILYRLEVDSEGLISRYEIWADPLSAYLASRV